MTDEPAADCRAECADSSGGSDVARLVTAHYAAVYRYAFRLTGTVAEAEDLAQQTFLSACANLGQLRDGDRAGAWLLATVRNTYLKTKRRRTPVAATTLAVELDELASDGPDRRFEIDREKLQAALDELPDEFKVVVLMFYFEDRSYKEIAAELAAPIGTVMSRLSRAKAHLRAKLVTTEPQTDDDTPSPTRRPSSGSATKLRTGA